MLVLEFPWNSQGVLVRLGLTEDEIPTELGTEEALGGEFIKKPDMSLYCRTLHSFPVVFPSK